MMTKIPLPKVWDKNLNYIGEIRPIKVSATIKLVPLSYASLQLPKGVNVPARGFVELFSSMGSLGIFRVRSPQDAYGDDITTAELEHAITEVGDYLVLGSYDEMMPANQAFTTIFSHYRGNHWQLGSVAALGTDQIAVQADHVRVLECLISLLEQKTDCMMAFDFSTTPWTLNFVKRDTVVSAEGRLARNVNFAKVSYDDTELCTRAYFQVSATEEADPSGFPAFDVNLNYSAGVFVSYGGKLYRLPNGHVAGVAWGNTQKTLVNDVPSTTWQYVDSDTIGTYGIVEKEVYSGGDYTDTEVLRVVQDFLNKHKEPRVSVEISAEELSSITGEPFDTFTIGKLCRLALVDYGVTIERTITGLSWDNVYGDPLDITVNLADEEDTAINFLHDVDTNGGTIGGSGGGGGGGGKKKQEDVWKEYRTKFQQTDYYFDLSATRYNRSEEILQQAGLYIDANGVLLYADDNEKQIGSRFKVAADAITAEVQRATGAEAGLKSSIKVEADKISLVVEGTGENARIKPASIVAAINDGESTIKISADHIQLDGNTIATYLSAIDLSVKALTVTNGEINCDAINGGQIDCTGIDTNEGNVFCGAIDCDSIQSNGASLNVADISKSGNTLTITKVDGSTITFSKATTLSGEYGGDNTGDTATYTVTATPQGNTLTGSFTVRENKNAAWIEDANGAIRARIDNPEWNNGGKTAAIASVTATSGKTASMVLGFGTQYLITPKYTNKSGSAVNTSNTYVVQSPAFPSVTLDCDSVGDEDYDVAGNVYAKANGSTRATKQITITKGAIKDNGKMAMNAYCDGTRVNRTWATFSAAKLYADHYDSTTRRYYFYSTLNITSGNRMIFW